MRFRYFEPVGFVVIFTLFSVALAFCDNLTECEKRCKNKKDCELCEMATTEIYG